jgi:predicted nucleic acid-binding protein
MAELLQGSGVESEFNNWTSRFAGLHYYEATHDTWTRAARASFQLIRRGLTTALSDLVIAQVALDNDLSVFATDTDFERVPGLKLHKAGA